MVPIRQKKTIDGSDYSKHTYFRWKIKWRLEHLCALGTMGETAPLTSWEANYGWCFEPYMWPFLLRAWIHSDDGLMPETPAGIHFWRCLPLLLIRSSISLMQGLRPMYENPESGIQQLFAVGIRNPETRIWNTQWFGIQNPLWYGIQKVGIRNPKGWNPKSRCWDPESRGWDLESRTFVDSLTYGERTSIFGPLSCVCFCF